MLAPCHDLLLLVAHLLVVLAKVVLGGYELTKIGLHTQQLLLIGHISLVLCGPAGSCAGILHLVHQIHHIARHLGLAHAHVLHVLLLEHPLLGVGIGGLLIVLMLVIVLHESLYN